MAFNVGAIHAALKLSTKDFSKGIKQSLRGMTRLKHSAKDITKALGDIGKKMMLVGAATTAGIGVVGKHFLYAATTMEGYRTRLRILLGSIKEGSRLFKNMSDYAARVPFEFADIMDAATSLSGVMKGGVDEVSKWMPMIGDLAAVTGESITDATNQLIRMYSAGASAADRWRDKGITAMLGFKMGVKYTAEETRKMLMESWNKAGSQFKGATDLLAKNWSGLMSMMSDKWFAFRATFMEAGPFDVMKTHLGAINLLLDKHKKKIDAWVTKNAMLIAQLAAIAGGLGLASIAVGGLAFSMSKLGLAMLSVTAQAALIVGGIALIGAGIYALRSAWKQNLGEMQDMFVTFYNNLKKGVTLLRDIWVSIGQSIFSTWDGTMRGIWKITKSVINDIIKMFLGMGIFIKFTMESLFKDIKGRVVLIGLRLKSMKALAFGTIEEYWSAIDEYKEKAISSTKSLEEVVKNTSKKLKEIYKKDFVGGAIESSKLVLDEFKKFGNLLIEEFDGTGDTLKEWWEAIKTTANEDMDSMMNTLREKFPAFASLLDEYKEKAEEIRKALAASKIEAPSVSTGGKPKGEGEVEGEGELDTEESTPVAEGFADAWQTAFTNTINKTKDFKDIMKQLFIDMGNSILNEITSAASKRLVAMLKIGKMELAIKKLFGVKEIAVANATELGKTKVAQAGVFKRVALAIWEGARKVASEIAYYAISLAKYFAFAVKWIAVSIYKLTADFIAAHAHIPYVGLAVGAALAAVAITLIVAAKPSLQEGTDYVPSTGEYKLHAGEKVVPAHATEDSDEMQVQIVNMITPEAVALTLQERMPSDVILNIIDANSLASGIIRTVVKRG